MPSGDGVSVVSSYNKILDSLIESIVTSGYRRFALKQGPVILRTNDPLEKALHLVISKKYTLSSGRIYGLIKALRNGEKLYEFGEYFKRYLDKYPTLRDLLMNDTFFKPYARLIESEVFGGKRHNGRISLEETTDARGILVGNYQDRDGLIYQLLLHASVLF